MAVSDSDLQAAVDTLTTDRVVQILQSQDEVLYGKTGKNAMYCVVRENYNDATYALANGKACWVEVTDASNAATQAAELLAGLSNVGPLDPDTLSGT